MSEADSQISRKSKMPEAMVYKYVRTYVVRFQLICMRKCTSWAYELATSST